MIVTDSFVWINYPKTASTFVRTVLRHLYSNPPRFRLLKRWRTRGRRFNMLKFPESRTTSGARAGVPTPHGTCSQIPDDFRHLPVVSAIRSPFDRVISLYEYADWKKPEALVRSPEQTKLEFEGYPDLSFSDYLDFLRTYRYGSLVIAGETVPVGPLSFDFLKFFYSSPVPEHGPVEVESKSELLANLVPVRFLRTENINSELAGLLGELGFKSRETDYVRGHRPVNTSRRRPDLSDYFTRKSALKYRDEEWLFFELFPEYASLTGLLPTEATR